ncbi:hypothetical protein C2G38_2081256, partial [Gigaspora rosea]
MVLKAYITYYIYNRSPKVDSNFAFFTRVAVYVIRFHIKTLKSLYYRYRDRTYIYLPPR